MRADKTMTEKLQIVEMDHSELGPSSSERWIACPGSVLMTRDIQEESSIFAAEGNAAHELSEWCRVQQKPAEHWEGKIIVVGDYEFEVDHEMIDSVNEFVEYVEQWPGDALIEERVDFDRWVPKGFGTMDDGRLARVVRLTDLKYGKGVKVFATDNSQLKIYALGVIQDFEHLYDFDEFVLTIHQPRLNHVDTFVITKAELLEWGEDVLRPAALRTLEPDAPLIAGDHCMFCKARKICKVRADYLMRAALEDFNDLDAGPKELMFLSNEEVAELLPYLANIKKWCNDLESYALGELAKGHQIGGYKVVAGRANRVFKDAEEAEKELEQLGGAYEHVLLSPAKAEKKYGKKKVAHLITQPQGKPTLASPDDSREPLVLDASSEFDSLED
jgi:hypothetical protein